MALEDAFRELTAKFRTGVGANWLAGQENRKRHWIKGSAWGPLTDYPRRIIVHYGLGVDSGEDVYLNRKCRVDLGDVRFTAYDGSTQLDYWREGLQGSDFLAGGSASASSEWPGGGYEAWRAFDNNEATRWSSDNVAKPHWLKYDLGAGVTKIAQKLRLKPFLHQVKDFKLQGSNNDADWDDLYTGLCGDNDTWHDFEFSNTMAYRYYRILITSGYEANQSSIWEIELMELESAHFWVEIDEIPASPAETAIYLYYGNDAASTTSDGEATFSFFDDFSGTDLDGSKWDTDGFAGFPGLSGYYSVASGLLTTWGDGATWRILRAITDVLVSDRVAVLTKIRRAGTACAPHHALTESAGTNQQRVCLVDAGEDGDWDYQRGVDGVYTSVENLGAYAANTWYYAEICRTSDTSFIARVRNADWTQLFGQSDSQAPWNINFAPVFWRKRNIDENYEFFLIREYVDPEPTDQAWDDISESVSLFARFEVGQDSIGLFSKARIQRAGSDELFAKFDTTRSIKLFAKFEVGQDANDLLAHAKIRKIDSVELLSGAEVEHPIEVALIELEPGSSKTFVPKIHSLNGALIELEPGSSKTFVPKIHSLNSVLVELEPGSDKELALRFRSLTGAPLDTIGGPHAHYKPDYIRSREGEAFDVYGGPLTHYKPDYLRSREGSEFLTLWSLWDDWRDLDCSFEVLRGWADLQSKFETGQGSVGLLARVEVGQDSGDLLARFEAQTTRDLLARAEVGQDSEGLLGKVDVRHVGTPLELLGKTAIRQVGTPVELLAKVEVYHWDDLKGRLCVPKVYDFSDASGVAFFWWGAGRMDQYIDFEVRTPTGSWIGKFPDGPAEWRLIFLEWDDLVEVDLDGSRPDKSKINGFFWTYHTPGIRRLDALLAIEEPLFWHTDLCVADVYFFTRVIEEWNWDEQRIVTAVLEDTYTRLSYWVPGGNGGWRYATTNYGTSGYLRCSKFYDRPPGSYDTQIDDEEIFIKFALSGMGISSLDRLGWARMELFRYEGYQYAKSRLNARRIAQCDETGVTYVFWNFESLIGGCESGRPHSATPPHAWSETSIAWYNTGRYHLKMGSVWWYMGLPGFTQSSPTSHYGLTTDNNVWDMIRVDEILASWLNGTYRNEGFGIRAEGIDGGDSSGEMNTFYETPRFYSSRAADSRKPQLRLQYIPEASIGLWSFASADRWEINLIDPYRGAGSLHLIDWTKVSYDRSRTNTAKATLQTDLTFAEGCVETVYRLNNATYPQLMYRAGYPPNKVVGYTTPIDNFFNVYFRYQNSSNYYMIQLKPAGETSKIIRRRNAASTTLETFDSGIAVGDWERIRVFWVEDGGELHICCYIWDGADWSFLAGYADENNYWAAGGDVAFESYDAELDDTEISERIFP